MFPVTFPVTWGGCTRNQTWLHNLCRIQNSGSYILSVHLQLQKKGILKLLFLIIKWEDEHSLLYGQTSLNSFSVFESLHFFSVSQSVDMCFTMLKQF